MKGTRTRQATCAGGDLWPPPASLLLFFLIVPHLGQAQRSPPQPALALAHVTVIDATGAPAQPDMTLLITGDRIRTIGKDGSVAIPKEAHVVDASHKSLIPGLWDMHMHIFNNVSGRAPNEFYLPLFVANGVTGVRDMWTKPENMDYVRDWRVEMGAGRRLGPRIAAVGTIVDGPKPWFPSAMVTTADDGRRIVDSLKRAGVDFVKVLSLVPRDAYFGIVQEARNQGIPFAGHVPMSVSAAEASNAGQKSFEHLYGILLSCSARETELMAQMLEAINRPGVSSGAYASGRVQLAALLDSYDPGKAQRLFALLRKNGTWQVPTLIVKRPAAVNYSGSVTHDARLKYIPAWMLEEWRSETGGVRTPQQVADSRRLFTGSWSWCAPCTTRASSS